MDRRIEKTKRAIRDAYMDLLIKKNIKITISEIARNANIDRKTFYLHYESIDDILKEFAQEKIDDLIRRLKPHYEEDRPINVKYLFAELNYMLNENMAFFRFIALNQKYDYFFDRLKELFVSILIDNYRIYFTFSEVEFRIYADYFVSGILSVYMRWIREELPVTLDRLSELVSMAAYRGLKDLVPQQLKEE